MRPGRTLQFSPVERQMRGRVGVGVTSNLHPNPHPHPPNLHEADPSDLFRSEFISM